jgi:hypothetical protein
MMQGAPPSAAAEACRHRGRGALSSTLFSDLADFSCSCFRASRWMTFTCGHRPEQEGELNVSTITTKDNVAIFDLLAFIKS